MVFLHLGFYLMMLLSTSNYTILNIQKEILSTPLGIDNRDINYEYMSRPDERSEAYTMNIADELVRKASKDGAIDLLRMANKTAQFKDEMGNLLSPIYSLIWACGSLIPHTQFLKDYIRKFISILLSSHPNYYTNVSTNTGITTSCSCTCKTCGFICNLISC